MMAQNAYRRGFALTLAAATALSSTPSRTDAQDTQDQLVAMLNANPAFRARIPATHRAYAITFAGSVLPGPLVWEGDPTEPAIVPRGLASTVVRNCQFGNVPISSGNLQGSFRETRSLTISASVTVGASLSIEGTWPFGSVGAEASLEVSTAIGSTTETSEELVFSQGFSAPVPPRTEFDIQLQMFEQQIDGQPFSFDAELRGNATVLHLEAVEWAAYRGGALPRNAVIAGQEPASAAEGGSRSLAVCRAQHGGAQRPGKVVGQQCNYAFDGREHQAGNFEVLVAWPGQLIWRSRANFEDSFDPAAVIAGRSSGIVAGRADRDDRYGGRLLVCRATHLGNTHPGKVVGNQCRFGYGGEEIRANQYELLTRANMTRTAGGTVTIALQDYLPFESRSFRIEGVFDGARSVSYSVVYGSERPVQERFCPSQPLPASATRDSPALLEASVARQPEALAPPAPRAPGAPGAPAPTAEAAPLTYEPVIEGRAYIRAEVDDEAGPMPRLAAFRLIRLDRPHQFGADVLAVQEGLRAAGWPVLADGFFGPRTDAALRHFQRANGLHPDGVAGPLTLGRLGL